MPGTSVKMPPSLIGAPFAFFPLPRPQTLLVAEAWPAPTAALPAAPDVLAVHAATSRPMRQLTARTLPSFFDLIPSSLPGLLLVVGAGEHGSCPDTLLLGRGMGRAQGWGARSYTIQV